MDFRDPNATDTCPRMECLDHFEGPLYQHIVRERTTNPRAFRSVGHGQSRPEHVAPRPWQSNWLHDWIYDILNVFYVLCLPMLYLINRFCCTRRDQAMLLTRSAADDEDDTKERLSPNNSSDDSPRASNW